MKMWVEARNELLKTVTKIHNKDFKTSKNGKTDEKKEFYKIFLELKKAVENYERVYQIHRITDKITRRKS